MQSLSDIETMGSASFNDQKLDELVKTLSKQQNKTETARILDSLEGGDRELYDAVQSKSFDMRSRLGQQWSRSGAKTEEYKKLQGWQAKREFRQRWAESKLQVVIDNKVRTTKISSKWLKNGRFMSFRKIWEQEGLDEAGFRAALLHVKSCIKRGPEFLRDNQMTGRIDFLWFEVGKDESFEEEYKLKTVESSKPKLVADQGQGSKSEANPPPKADVGEGSQAVGGVKRKGIAEATPQKADKPSKEITKEINKEATEAKKIKDRYHKVTSGIASIKAAVDSDNDWAWLREAPVLMQPLLSASSALSSALTPFAAKLFNFDLKEARANLEPAELLTCLRAISVQISGPLQAAEKQIHFLRATHALKAETA